MIRLSGRTLQRPALLYNNKEVILNSSSWNLGTVSFRKPVGLVNWACLRIIENSQNDGSIYTGRCREQLQKFLSHLKLKGIKVDDRPNHGDLGIRSRQDYVKLDGWFKECLQGYDVNFLIVFLPDRRTSELYNTIKRYGDVKHGIHTVCVTSKKLGSPQYDENVALVSAATFLF